MTKLRITLFALIVAVPSLAHAQAAGHSMPTTTTAEKATPSVSQPAFDTLKTLAGSWVGRLSTVPAEPSVDGNFAQITMRVTSLGNAFMHELSVSGRADHPLTMFYREADTLLLTHYCDAGNRPRMTATPSPDGKVVDFTFLDLSGGNTFGHMHHATFTFIDTNHHTEDWTYMNPDNTMVRAHFELQRTNMDRPTN